MTIFKVPESVAVSPHNGTPIRYDTETRLLVDEVGNSWHLDDPAKSRPWNEAAKWARENYPLPTGNPS